MKRVKWLALFAVLALVLAACGDGDDGAVDTTEGDGGAADTTAAPTPDTTEAPDTGAMAGQGGELLLLQWQAPSQANAYLSTGTKDLLAGSIVA